MVSESEEDQIKLGRGFHYPAAVSWKPRKIKGKKNNNNNKARTGDENEVESNH